MAFQACDTIGTTVFPEIRILTKIWKMHQLFPLKRIALISPYDVRLNSVLNLAKKEKNAKDSARIPEHWIQDPKGFVHFRGFTSFHYMGGDA